MAINTKFVMGNAVIKKQFPELPMARCMPPPVYRANPPSADAGSAQLRKDSTAPPVFRPLTNQTLKAPPVYNPYRSAQLSPQSRSSAPPPYCPDNSLPVGVKPPQTLTRHAPVYSRGLVQRMEDPNESHTQKRRREWEEQQLSKKKAEKEKEVKRLEKRSITTRGSGDTLKKAKAEVEELKDVTTLPTEAEPPKYFIDKSNNIHKILQRDRPSWNRGAKDALATKTFEDSPAYCHLTGKHEMPTVIKGKTLGGPSLDHTPSWKEKKAGLESHYVCCGGTHYRVCSEYEAATQFHGDKSHPLTLVHKSCNSSEGAHNMRKSDVDSPQPAKQSQICPGKSCSLEKAFETLQDAKDAGGKEGNEAKGSSGTDAAQVHVNVADSSGRLRGYTF